MSNALSSEEPPFRPSKRRKFYRKHNAEDDDTTVATPVSLEYSTALPTTAGPQPDKPDDDLATENEEDNRRRTAEVLRRRQAARNRKGGIEFSNTKSEPTPSQPSNTLIERADPAKELQTVVNRFAPQTGQVADVDKHM